MSLGQETLYGAVDVFGVHLASGFFGKAGAHGVKHWKANGDRIVRGVAADRIPNDAIECAGIGEVGLPEVLLERAADPNRIVISRLCRRRGGDKEVFESKLGKNGFVRSQVGLRLKNVYGGCRSVHLWAG